VEEKELFYLLEPNKKFTLITQQAPVGALPGGVAVLSLPRRWDVGACVGSDLDWKWRNEESNAETEPADTAGSKLYLAAPTTTSSRGTSLNCLYSIQMKSKKLYPSDSIYSLFLIVLTRMLDA